MPESIDTTQTDPQTPEFDDGLPEGGHALEVAARAGFGPLSPLAQDVWHGQGVPCVSCGQLVHRDDASCEHCGQDLSEGMIQKMRQHAGPWFVLEHVRPFPGVSLERVIRQIRRGLITETSIVRGPSNEYQWRFAVETPGLCRYFGKCWCCHAAVSLSDTYCPHCLHYLSFERPRPGAQVPGSSEPRPIAEAGPPPTISVQHVAQAVAMGAPSRPPLPRPAGTGTSPTATQGAGNRMAQAAIDNRKSTIDNAPQSPDLARLSAAVRQARTTHRDSEWDEPPRVAGINVTWFAALLIVAALVALLLVSRARTNSTSPSLPTMSAPVSPPAPVGHVPPAPAPASPTTQPSPSEPTAAQPAPPTPAQPTTAPPANAP